MANIKPTSFVLDHAPWSASKADTANQCPYKFNLQYKQKKKMNVPPSKEALIGTAVHTALEYALGGKQTVARCFKMAIVEHRLTTTEIEDVKAFQPIAENFLRKFKNYCVRHNTSKPILEEQLGVDIYGNSLGFWDKKVLMRGVIDVSLIFSGKPHALILDHKTGKDHALKYFTNQFNTYSLLIKARTPELEEVKLGINFMKADRVEFKNEMQDVRDIQILMDKVISFLNDSTTDASENPNLVRSGPLCDWCQFISICPAHADGANEKQKR